MVDKKENQDESTVSIESLNNGHRVFDFLRFGLVAFVISMVLVVGSIVVMFVKGFNLGQDFTGGTTVEVTITQRVNIDTIRQTLSESGYVEPMVQHYRSDDTNGTQDIIIRLPPAKSATSEDQQVDNTVGANLAQLLQAKVDPKAQIKRVEFVGPTVGAELAQDGTLAILAALGSILIYIAFRFEWRFGLSAVIGLGHDVVITAGYLSLFQRELDLTIIAAMLSIIGYSLNDTIVVFDRVRENFRKIRRATPYDVINISLTQTLRRTLMTSGTTLAVVIILYIFGGPMLRGFSETLSIGIVLGTISSIYVAAYLALKFGVRRENFIQQQVEVEGADQDAIIR